MLVILACGFQPPLPYTGVQRPKSRLHLGVESRQSWKVGCWLTPTPGTMQNSAQPMGTPAQSRSPRAGPGMGAGRVQTRPHAHHPTPPNPADPARAGGVPTAARKTRQTFGLSSPPSRGGTHALSDGCNHQGNPKLVISTGQREGLQPFPVRISTGSPQGYHCSSASVPPVEMPPSLVVAEAVPRTPSPLSRASLVSCFPFTCRAQLSSNRGSSRKSRESCLQQKVCQLCTTWGLWLLLLLEMAKACQEPSQLP